MRSIYRRWTVAFLAMLILSACEMTPSAPPEVGAPTDRASGDVGPIIITFAGPAAERAIFEPALNAFNTANPDVRVQFVLLDVVSEPDTTGAGFTGVVERAVQSADTATVPFVSLRDIEGGLMRELTSFIDADAAFDRDDYYPGALERLSGARIYALPQTIEVPLLYYNKELWAQHALPTPNADWSWNDLLTAAEQLARMRGDTVEVYGLLDAAAALNTLRAALSTSSVNPFTRPPAQIRLDDPAVVAALEQVQALAQAGAIFTNTQALATDSASHRHLIRDGRAGLWRDTILRPDTANPQPSFAVGAAPYPRQLNAKSSNFVNSYVMSSGTQHPEAAWRWLSFLSRQVLPADHSRQVDGIDAPARRAIVEQSNYWDQLDAETAAAVRATLEQPRSVSAGDVIAPDHQAVSLALEQALQSVISGEAPAQAAANAQRSLETQLTQIQMTPAATTDPVPVIVATPAPETAAGVATTINFGVYGVGPLATDFRRIAEKFSREDSTIAVNIENADTASTIADVVGVNDCFAWFSPPLADEPPPTLDLRPLLDADASVTHDEYASALLAQFERDGVLYGLPYTINPRVLAYNQDAFEAIGLAPPRADWTTDDLLNAAQQLTSGEGATRRYGYASMSGETGDVDFILSRFDAATIQGDGATAQPNFTDPRVVEAIRYYVMLLRDYSPHQRLTGYTDGSWSNEVAAQLVFDGQVGMWLDYGIGHAEGAEERGLEVDVVAPLMAAGNLSENDFSLTGLYISVNTQHVDACWTWLKYLSSEVSVLKGAIPARRSAAESDAFAAVAPDGAVAVYQAYINAMKEMEREGRPLWSPRTGINYFWFYQAIDNALQGMDVERALTNAQTITEQHLGCVRSGGEADACARQVDPEYGVSAEP